ncbi:MAG: YigZ family protein [Clostridia bacterium]|nr:YigZ family protein [Clostridia bacterium]
MAGKIKNAGTAGEDPGADLINRGGETAEDLISYYLSEETALREISYLTVRDFAESRMTEKKSVFIASMAHVTTEAEAQAFVGKIRAEYPDARHNVYAYSLYNGGVPVRRFSDDGEPKGTAGMPVLDAIEKAGVTDAAVVVTRYFGGILLGASGLTRAYSNSATDVIRESGTVKMVMARKFVLSFGYEMYGKLNILLDDRKIIKEPPVFGSDVTLTVAVPEADAGRLIRDINDATSALCHIVPGEKGFCNIE